MSPWKNLFLTIAALAAFVVAILTLSEVYQGGLSAPMVTSLAAAIVAFLALTNSALAAAATEERLQFANSFAIARRWEDSPVREARKVLRPYLDKLDELAVDARTDKDLRAALIDIANFLWDMSAAIELNLADPKYLRLRFADTLETCYPAIQAMIGTSQDRGGKAALQSLESLRKRWNNSMRT